MPDMVRNEVQCTILVPPIEAICGKVHCATVFQQRFLNPTLIHTRTLEPTLLRV